VTRSIVFTVIQSDSDFAKACQVHVFMHLNSPSNFSRTVDVCSYRLAKVSVRCEPNK